MRAWGGLPVVAAVTLGMSLHVPEMHFLHLGNRGSRFCRMVLKGE